MGNEVKACQNCKGTFEVTADDTKFYEKMGVPAPTFCPDCRLQRRLAWRNERSLYRVKCGSCGKETISLYRPDGPIKTYCSPCWWSDKWEAMSFGKEYDFSKPFFVQFRELMERIPHQNLFVNYQTLVNSDYNNMNHNLKNCYWLFNSDYDEDCYYGEEVEAAKDCIDITMIDHSELIYESVNCNKCSRAYYSVDCEGCQDVWFSKNCNNCTSCFGCVNLKNQQYCIFNKQYTKEEYEKKIAEFNLGSYAAREQMKKRAKDFWLKFPYKYMHGKNNTDVSGDYIYHSKNVHNSYIALESENCKYCMWLIVKNNKDCYDYTQFGENTQLVYESMSSGNNVNNLISTLAVITGHSVQYSIYCWNNSANLFGCVGLRAKKYCILNKEYTKEKYEILVPKIIKQMNDMPYISKSEARNPKSAFERSESAAKAESNPNDQNSNIQTKEVIYRYGEFFPTEFSHFAYNESSAYEYFPLTKEQAQENAYPWQEPEAKNYQITLSHEDLADHINQVGDDITSQVISCQHEGPPAGGCAHQCTTAFRILPPELAFYKTHNIPLPHLCPNCRHYERVKERNPLKLYARQCSCTGNASQNNVYQNSAEHIHRENPCPNQFETTYSPDRPDIVYCEECYLKEVA